MIGAVDPLALAGLEHLDQGRIALDELTERECLGDLAGGRVEVVSSSSPAVMFHPLSSAATGSSRPAQPGGPCSFSARFVTTARRATSKLTSSSRSAMPATWRGSKATSVEGARFSITTGRLVNHPS